MYRVISFTFGGRIGLMFTLALLLSIAGVGGVEGSSPKSGACIIAVACVLFYSCYKLLVQDMRARSLR